MTNKKQVQTPSSEGEDFDRGFRVGERRELSSPDYRRQVLSDPRAHAYTVESDEKWAAFVSDKCQPLTPEEEAKRWVGWCDANMDAAHWFSRFDVDPAKAAMVLCQLNPNTDTDPDWPAENTTTDQTVPRDFVKLRQRFEDLSRVEPRFRTLRDWLHAAKGMKARYHSWIDEYVDAFALLTPDAPPAPTDGIARCVAADSGEAIESPPLIAERAPAGDAYLAEGRKPWMLKRPRRFPGYRKALFDVLRAALVADRSCPSAREVLDEWQLKRPFGVARTTPDTIDYCDAKGNEHTANLKAIQQAINNLTD